MCVHELSAESSVFLSLRLLTLIGKPRYRRPVKAQFQSGHLLFLFSIFKDGASIPAHGQYTVISRRRMSK